MACSATPTQTPAFTPEGVTDWGPLAVIDEGAETIASASGGDGVLRIGQRCTTLVLSDGRELALVWRNSQTQWVPPDRIVFDDIVSGRRLELVDGDRVEVGGKEIVAAPWISSPQAECPSERFVVHTLTVP